MKGSHVSRIVLVLLLTALPAAKAKVYKWEVLDPDATLKNQAKAVLAIQKQPARWCSSVLVGPRVMLTAAHCVDHGGVKLKTNGGKTQKVPCWCPGSWPAQNCGSLPGAWSTVDLAVCLLPTATTTTVEALSTDISVLSKDADVVLAGFGCIAWPDCTNSEKRYAKTAQAGPARVFATVSPKDLSFLTIGDLAHGESALCPGDSGGPVFVETGGSRKVIGIGRAGCAQDDESKSEVVNLAAEETVRWLCTWMKQDASRTVNGLTSCP